MNFFSFEIKNRPAVNGRLDSLIKVFGNLVDDFLSPFWLVLHLYDKVEGHVLQKTLGEEFSFQIFFLGGIDSGGLGLYILFRFWWNHFLFLNRIIWLLKILWFHCQQVHLSVRLKA